jgi:hypothetical protein
MAGRLHDGWDARMPDLKAPEKPDATRGWSGN